MYNGGGTILLLSTSSLRYLGKRIGLSSTVERVPALHNASQSQHYSTILLKPRLTASRLRRTYAQKVVPRPKANTGGATTSATKAAKKPAPKKTTPKSLPKATSKAKPVKAKTKAKTKVKKPKAKKPKVKKPKAKKPKAKKPKKELTAEEKTRKTIKELRAKALKAPPQLSTAAWQLFLTEKLRAAEKVEGRAFRKQFTAVLKEASAAYKELAAEQLEQYNRIANQNKIANAATYREWIESHTPIAIHQANLARLHLKRLGVRTSVLKDERQVTSIRTPYIFFFQSRSKSGDYKNMKAPVAGELAGREWKALTDEQKKPFYDLAAQDSARYTQERKTVMDLEAKPATSKKLTA